VSNRLRQGTGRLDLPPVVIDPPERTGSGPRRVRIIIDIRQTVAPRPQPRIWPWLFWLALALLLFAA
jgi:hypothetical protein